MSVLRHSTARLSALCRTDGAIPACEQSSWGVALPGKYSDGSSKPEFFMSKRVVLKLSGGVERNRVIAGKWVRTAAIHDEEWIEGDITAQPEDFARSLRVQGWVDIF